MKKVKYQVQRRTNFNGAAEALTIFSKHRTPLKALCQMETLALEDINIALSNHLEVTISRTSDSRYPDAWGMANNGILIKAGVWWWQWEVVEV